ncbi:MAG: bifunctional [glutamine synthetase] adenylyltransferase/[glutamine synthetase]-adenylyl-L-tyrosine phosphorylase [Rickettsiales bacterium]|nr:bifunctional [glutamine synthetase] adenylyltransferase/[glutamine synthetase]-adenylyl-L-tyrosine phosphorylase [Rickettsiales bacterium]
MLLSTPTAYSQADLERNLIDWRQAAAQQESRALSEWMTGQEHHPLLRAVFGNSPYLSRLLCGYPQLFYDFITNGADSCYAQLVDELAAHDINEDVQKSLMKRLREAKHHIALLVALADIASEWNLEKVTQALSAFAEQSLVLTVSALLAAAARRGEITHGVPKDSGIIILGMGKLGGRELNYSSDIDLIIFYEPERIGYQGRQSEQYFMNRLAQDIVQVMQERTKDGYVFRTDLRLRPDPASMPPAITVDGAYYYYEGVGQNWERAAMIKARPVAGDYEAGERFIKNLSPFMWRRNLDFAAINDIQSIKRQMDSRQTKQIMPKGHNVKLGLGGIREIEFYVQIHQLIWGGREARLRSRATCETLSILTQLGLVEAYKQEVLEAAYQFLRKLEHRLQMVDDQQTHSLPTTDEGVEHIACFMGYASVADFTQVFQMQLLAVHDIFSHSFTGADALGDEGSLVFTGVSHDPETLDTLRHMGYGDPEKLSDIVMGWHHGSSRATRSKRARELLTELMPTILRRLAETAHPDEAFLRFNEFLANLPAGVPVFSMFNANLALLDLVADIFGSAPMLADYLSKSPSLLEVALYSDFYQSLPEYAQLEAQLTSIMMVNEDIEDQLDAITRFRNEKQFQAGVHLLQHRISAEESAIFISHLAEIALKQVVRIIQSEFSRTYGTIAGGEFAIIALGKLGSREMTFSSDIDLVFIYDVPDFEALSDGEKAYTASIYYNRFVQRLLSALTLVGREGRLYEVDTRLRPSGKQGMLTVSTKALQHYFDELAWTFEYMAFTKARVVVSDENLNKQLDSFIVSQLTKSRDTQKLRSDVADMRQRMDKEFATTNPWDIKYVRGGITDLDFIAQYLLLLHAPDVKTMGPGNSKDILNSLAAIGKVSQELARELVTAYQFMTQIFNVLRLCGGHDFEASSLLPGLQKLVCISVEIDDFDEVKKRLIAIEERVYHHYMTILEAK